MVTQDKLIQQIKDYILTKTIYKTLNISKDFTIHFLAQGEYNLNFTISDILKKYVFRVNLGSQIGLDKQITYEYNALKTLELSGVTPKVYHVDDTKTFFEYGILIMEFLYGEPLTYDRDLKKASQIFAKIHSLDITKNSKTFIIEQNIFSQRIKESNRLLKNVLDSDVISVDLKKFFIKFLEWAENNEHKQSYYMNNSIHVINNTEVNSHNFIIGDKKSYLIDWEKPVISDPCQDLTQFLATTTTLWKRNYILSKDETKMFFKSYNHYLDIKVNDIEERVHLYTPYLYLRALSWCAYAFLEYQNPYKNIFNPDTYNKIKEYLDVDFIKRLLKQQI